MGRCDDATVKLQVSTQAVKTVLPAIIENAK
jgi:hypothetical protein